MILRPGLASMSCSLPSRSTTVIRAIHTLRSLVSKSKIRWDGDCAIDGRVQAPFQRHGAAPESSPCRPYARDIKCDPLQADVVIQPEERREPRAFPRGWRTPEVGFEQGLLDLGRKIVVGAPAGQIP